MRERLPLFKTLILNTIEKEFRNRTLIFLSVFTLLILLAEYSFFEMFKNLVPPSSLSMLGASEKALTFKASLFFAIINSWNAFLASLLTISSFKSDFEANIVQEILSFPIRRWEFLAARLLGILSIVFIHYVIFFALGSVVLSENLQGFTSSLGLGFISLFATLPFLAIVILNAAWISLLVSPLWSFTLTLVLSLWISYANYLYSGQFWDVLVQAPSVISQTSSQLASYLPASRPGFFHYFNALLHTVFPHMGTLKNLPEIILTPNSFFESKAPLSWPLEVLHFILSTGALFGWSLHWLRRKI